MALTEGLASAVTWRLATSYKWVSFSPTISASLVGGSLLAPPSTLSWALGCGRLGSGVMSCRRRFLNEPRARRRLMMMKSGTQPMEERARNQPME